MDAYEIAGCYDTYVEDCDCCDDIPISFELWQCQFLAENLFILGLTENDIPVSYRWVFDESCEKYQKAI